MFDLIFLPADHYDQSSRFVHSVRSEASHHRNHEANTSETSSDAPDHSKPLQKHPQNQFGRTRPFKTTTKTPAKPARTSGDAPRLLPDAPGTVLGYDATALHATTLRFHDATTLRRCDATTPQHYNATTLRRYDATTLRRYDTTMQRHYDATTQLCNDATALSRYDATTL